MKPTFLAPLFLCALTGALSPLAAQRPSEAAKQQPLPPPRLAEDLPPDTRPPAPPEPNTLDRDAPTLSLYGWYPASTDAWMKKGDLWNSERSGDVELNRAKKRVIPGAMLTFPAGKGHHLKFSYFQTQASGNNTAGVDLNLFAGDYDKGAYLATRYKLQNAKITFDYTSWPFPIADRKLRLKTYWGVQYTNIKTTIDEPLKVLAEGESAVTEGQRWFIWPSLGGGMEYRASPNFRFEAGGSGFYLPNRPNIWDASAVATVRAGKIEIMFGAKAFHFQTSRKPEEFFRGTMAGVFAGIGYRFQ